MKTLLGVKNSKVGKSGTFSLPAVKSCPGATKECSTSCYALQGYYRTNRTKDFLARNFLQSLTYDFVDRMIMEIGRTSHRHFRIHPSGDFYSVRYVKRWIRIAKAFPGINFWGYTRSWSMPRFTKSLRELAGLPNVSLWASVDDGNIHLPLPRFMKKAFMSIDDQPPIKKVDLIFRDNYFPKNNNKKNVTVVKKIGGVRVCPLETGIKNENLSCETCKICL